MKIGILTFHCALNYGAVLQTYGLQEYLKCLGHEVSVIDYRPAYLTDQYNVFKWYWNPDDSIVRNVMLLIRNLIVLPVRLKRKKRFADFIGKYLNIRQYRPNGGLSDFDAFVFGSDQIWNPKLTQGFDKVFFGFFPDACGKKLISYAASAGSVECIQPYENTFLSMLSAYTHVSSREQSVAEWIHRHLPETKCYVTLDPVLLADKSVFTSIADKKKSREPYLLIFKLAADEPDTVSDIAKKIAGQKRLHILELVSVEYVRNLSAISSATLERFISLFRDASYVITTSYHGMVFSMLFEKDFNYIGLQGRSIERIDYLLSELGLSNRKVVPGSDAIADTIDYEKVNLILQKKRDDSRNFIRQALT